MASPVAAVGLVLLLPLVACRVYSPKVQTAAPELMPQFPWPPPRWTSRFVLPDSLATTGEGDTLGVVFARIRQALTRAGIDQWSVYAVGDDGFAIATQPENIEDDGRPKPPPARWQLGPNRTRPTSLGDYFRALFSADPGHYRFMILVVTSRTVVAGTAQPDTATMDSLARSGAGTLESALESRILGAGSHCEALVYEYARRSANDRALFIASSGIPALKHVAEAGLWTEQELR